MPNGVVSRAKGSGLKITAPLQLVYSVACRASATFLKARKNKIKTSKNKQTESWSVHCRLFGWFLTVKSQKNGQCQTCEIGARISLGGLLITSGRFAPVNHEQEWRTVFQKTPRFLLARLHMLVCLYGSTPGQVKTGSSGTNHA